VDPQGHLALVGASVARRLRLARRDLVIEADRAHHGIHQALAIDGDAQVRILGLESLYA
jgi:hypothetical protein